MKTIGRFLVLVSLVGLLPVAGQAASTNQLSRQPNLVLIMADDLGYETIGANGGTSYRTPVLDKLAATGARFTHCYAQPLCTPTRVQLMTGLSNVRNYIRFGHIDAQARTFAHALKQVGYTTGVFGKWQLGQEVDLPKRLGFDEHVLWQHTRRPPRYANPGLEYNGVEKDFKSGEYGPDLLNAAALDFISRHRDVSFLLYYPMVLTHSPYQPTPNSPDWDPKALGESVNVAKGHFGDMVEYMDKLVGRVVDRLDQLKLRENTLVLFLGDNGTGRGTKSMLAGREITGGKGLTTKAGMHVPLIAHWPEKVPAGTVCTELVDTTDFMPTLLEAAGHQHDLKLDGRSFLRQMSGQPAEPRGWIYSWYSPRQNRQGFSVREFAFNQNYKLYQDGSFFNVAADPDESSPLTVDRLDAQAKAAHLLLKQAIDQFCGVRPADLDERGLADMSAQKPQAQRAQ